MWTRTVDNARVTIVHNARKRLSAVRRFAELLRAGGLEVTTVTTTRASEGGAAAQQAVATGANVIVAAGGDGTVRSVLPALASAECAAALGVLPLGAANDFACELGIRGVPRAAQAVLGRVACAWDLGSARYATREGDHEDGAFCSSAGVGLIARALGMAQTRTGELWGRVLGDSSWPALVTAAASALRPAASRVRFGEVSVTRDLTLLEISKLPAPRGVTLTPDARGDSGIFHAWLVSRASPLQLAGVAYDALAGNLGHLHGEHVDYVSYEPSQNRLGLSRITRIEVDCERPLPVHINGDAVGTTPVRFTLRPRALQVLVPGPLAGDGALREPERESLRPSLSLVTSARGSV